MFSSSLHLGMISKPEALAAARLAESGMSVSRIAVTLRRSRGGVAAAITRARRNVFDRLRPARAPKAVALRRAAAQIAASISENASGRRFPAFPTAKRVAEELHRVTGVKRHRRTVCRWLRDAGFRSRVRRPVPTRDREELQVKRRFARRYLRKSAADLRRICFSDETWLTTAESTGRTQWVPPDTKPIPIEKKSRWNEFSVMVWGCIGIGWRSPLIFLPVKRRSEHGELLAYRLNASDYIRRCLAPIVPDLVKHKKIFQHDGARAHVAKSVVAYFKKKKVQFIPDFPPYSPDLNPIESLWAELKRRVGEYQPRTQEELKEAGKRAWQEIPQRVVDRHVLHFRRALRNVESVV